MKPAPEFPEISFEEIAPGHWLWSTVLRGTLVSKQYKAPPERLPEEHRDGALALRWSLFVAALRDKLERP